MYDLEFIIVTYNRPKYLKETLESFIVKKNNFNTRLLVLDGGNDNFLEDIDGEKKNTSKVFIDFKNEHRINDLVKYKQYNNNGNWHKIITDYVFNLSKAKYFAIIGDDDIFLDFNGFEKSMRFIKTKFKSEKIGIINLFYQDNTRINVIPIIDEMIDGKAYINNFIDLNYLDTQSVMHLYNLDIIKKYNCLHFLKLREKGLEDFFGWDIHFIFSLASNSKILYVNSNQTIEMGHQGNEIRYTVKFPLTQWICYYLYSKYTVTKLRKEGNLNLIRYRKFMLHWINSFFICYSKYLFSEYETREKDYNKVREYLKQDILIFVFKEIIKNWILINIKILSRIGWIILLIIRRIKNRVQLKLRVKSLIKKLLKFYNE